MNHSRASSAPLLSIHRTTSSGHLPAPSQSPDAPTSPRMRQFSSPRPIPDRSFSLPTREDMVAQALQARQRDRHHRTAPYITVQTAATRAAQDRSELVREIKATSMLLESVQKKGLSQATIQLAERLVSLAKALAAAEDTERRAVARVAGGTDIMGIVYASSVNYDGVRNSVPQLQMIKEGLRAEAKKKGAHAVVDVVLDYDLNLTIAASGLAVKITPL